MTELERQYPEAFRQLRYAADHSRRIRENLTIAMVERNRELLCRKEEGRRN